MDVENNSTFRIGESQNIDNSSYPINLNHLSDLYNLSIPKHLPNISLHDIENKGLIDTNYILVSLDMLSNLFNQMPLFSIPPCLNIHKIDLNDDHLRKHVTDILGKTYASNILPPNYAHQQISQSTQTLQQQQQQQSKT